VAENPDTKIMPDVGDLRVVSGYLQKYEWSIEDGKFDWYDVPIIDEPPPTEDT
jgi:hypothetical protein